MSNGQQTTSPLAAIFGYQLDANQFKLVESVVDSLQRMSEAVVRLAPPKVRLRFTHRKSGFTFEGENILMNLKNDEEVDGELVFTNSKGGPAKAQEDSIVWSAVTETGAFTVEQDASNKKKCVVRGNPSAEGNDLDVGVVRVKFDGDAGEGIKEQTGEGAINVIAGDASTFEVKFGTPRPQAATEPTPIPEPTPEPAPPTP